MGASDWADAEDGPARKRGVPAWVFWGCGGGCLVALLLLAGLLVLGGSLVREAFDPEKAWSGVAELLPHDERPAGWAAYGATRFGIGFYILQPPEPHAVLIVQRARDAAEIEALLEPDSAARMFWKEWVPEAGGEHEAGTIELQGRTVRCLRYAGTYTGPGVEGDEMQASGLRIDLSGTGVPTLLHVVLGPGPDQGPDARVAELLAPFDLWRGR